MCFSISPSAAYMCVRPSLQIRALEDEAETAQDKAAGIDIAGSVREHISCKSDKTVTDMLYLNFRGRLQPLHIVKGCWPCL